MTMFPAKKAMLHPDKDVQEKVKKLLILQLLQAAADLETGDGQVIQFDMAMTQMEAVYLGMQENKYVQTGPATLRAVIMREGGHIVEFKCPVYSSMLENL